MTRRKLQRQFTSNSASLFDRCGSRISLRQPVTRKISARRPAVLTTLLTEFAPSRENSAMATARLNRLVKKLRDAIRSRQWETLSDHELLACFRSSRDESAFEGIVRRHAPAVLAAARRILSQPADVDDVFQATFLV